MGNKRRISSGGSLTAEAEIKGIFFFSTVRLQSAGIAETLCCKKARPSIYHKRLTVMC